MAKKKVSKASHKEPKTMAELLARAEKRIIGFSPGQKVRGKVVAKNSKSLVIDIGGKSEGIVTEKAFVEARDFIKTLEIGDEVTASVLIPETAEGYTVLSLRQAAFDSSWEKLEKAKEAKEAVPVVGRGVNPSGVMVEVEGLSGFIPGSQLGSVAAKNTQSLIGKYFKAIPVEVERLTNKIVLSERQISHAEDIKATNEALSKVKEGEIYDGEVTTVASFGCFVKINLRSEKKVFPIEGLVHVSELSWGKTESAADVVSEGDKVKVKVIKVAEGKLALSIRGAQKDPWEALDKKYKPETKVKGKVTRVSDFGIFVELEPGIEGLIHITKIPPGKRFSEGDEINCLVEEIDTKAKKLSLGLVLTSKPIGYK